MKLIKERGIWIWIGNYQTSEIPKTVKMRWDNDNEYWWTDQKDIAIKLIKFATGYVKAELEVMKDHLDQRLAESIATTSSMAIPVPDGLKYYGYQKAGIEYAIKYKKVLIGDEMGLGKTVQSIGVINATSSIKKILIICPASLKNLTWRDEINAWLTRDLKVVVLNSKSKSIDADIYIINYDITGKVHWLHDIVFDLLIADEAHKIKNKKTQRYQSFVELTDKIPRKLFLTGTPMLNKPIELFPLIELLGFEMEYWEFAKKYCDAKRGGFGWDMSGASNLEELQTKLRQSVMIRREKVDVLHELPAKIRQIVGLDPKKYKSFINAEKKFIIKHKPNFYDNRLQSYEDVTKILDKLSDRDVAELAKLRRATSMAKIDDVIKHANDSLMVHDKLVIFAHHRDVVEQIRDAFGDKAVMFRGGMKDEEKEHAVKSFQNDPNIIVFVGSIHAAGVGLTLTAASVMVFAELDWVPGILLQTEDRIHRIGQLQSVLIQHLVIDGSIDGTIIKTIVDKQNLIERTTNIKRVHQHIKKETKEIDDTAAEIDEVYEESRQMVNKMQNLFKNMNFD